MYKKAEKFIIGLGNPEKKYSETRHNVGFLLIEEFLAKHNSQISLKNKLKSYYSEFSFEGIQYKLFMPNTYMNNSGDAVRAIVDWFNIDINQLIIVVDDIDIPLGKIRFRRSGGSGGHNGLKSIINRLNSENFERIRIGIGSPPLIREERKFNTISHVLGKISKEEKEIFKQVFKTIINSIEILNSENQDSIICELNSFKIINHK